MGDQQISRDPQRVRPRAGCGREVKPMQGGCPRHVVSVFITGMQAVGGAVRAAQRWAIAEGGRLAALTSVNVSKNKHA